MMDSREDADLMADVASGDRNALGVLAERHHRAIIFFAQRMLSGVDPAAADDIAQDVFLAAWSAAPSYQPRAKVTTWLFRIATNRCLNHQRNQRRRATVPLGSDGVLDVSDGPINRPDAQAISREGADHIRVAVAALPVKQRAAILLRYFDDLSYADIADVLETSVSAVESLLFRARKALRAQLMDEYDGAPQVCPESGVE